MVAANGVMARTLMNAKVSSIRRVVKTPERWQRIVELAARYGEKLPPRTRFGRAQSSSCRNEKPPTPCTTPMSPWP